MSYNNIILVGNAGNDPELRYTPSGTPVANFRLAVSYRRGGENPQEETQWFTVSCWNRLSEQVNNYVNKGQKVLVEGRFRGRSYTAQDGTEKFVNEVMANRVVFLSGQGQSGGGAPSAMADATADAPIDDGNLEDIPF